MWWRRQLVIAEVMAVLTLASCGGEPRVAEPLMSVKVIDDSHVAVTYELPTCSKPAGHEVRYFSSDVMITMYSRNGPVYGCKGGLGQGAEDLVLVPGLNGRRIVDGACGRSRRGTTACERTFDSTGQ